MELRGRDKKTQHTIVTDVLNIVILNSILNPIRLRSAQAEFRMTASHTSRHPLILPQAAIGVNQTWSFVWNRWVVLEAFFV
jgi:hypothetical protein